MTNVELWVRHWELFSIIMKQQHKMFSCSVQEAANMSDLELQQEWEAAAQALGLLEESRMVKERLKCCTWTEDDSRAVIKIMEERRTGSLEKGRTTDLCS